MSQRRNNLILALAAAGLSSTAWTQDAESLAVVELSELFVTGSLWQSELLDTTASVTVLDDTRFTGDGSQHFENLINAIPNLTWTGGTSRPRYLQIRGIGENSQFEGETPDSSVRFVIDDLDFTGVGTIGSLFDMEQVEVLRGPQAGSFGLNAAGGVIKLVSADPTPSRSGRVETTIGEDNLISGGIAFGGPLAGEELTYRISVHQLNQDGWRENRTLDRDDTNERDELTTRLKLRWRASDAWTWDGTLFYADANNGYDEWSLDNTGFVVYSDEPGRDEQESFAGSLRGTWKQSEDASFTTITSLSATDSYYGYDSDWTTLNSEDPRSYDAFMEVARDREAFSQEVRYDSLASGAINRWTVGAYVGLLDETSDIDYRDLWSSPEWPVLADSSYESENFAVFGQVEKSLSERSRLTFGLRSEYYTIEAASDGLYYGDPLPSGNGKESGTVFGGNLTFENDLSDEHMFFATLARGYKAGGANIAAFLEEGDPLTYGDETLWNYELGLRSNWLHGKMTSTVTAFYLDRRDAQLRDSAGAGGFFRYFTSNQGDAEHIGLEAETRWYVSENWTLNAGIGLLDTEHAATGRELSNSPSYTYNAGLSYSGNSGFFGSLELSGRDEYYESNSVGNNEQRDAYSVVNTTIGYKYEEWTFSLWAKNLLDERYAKRLFYFGNAQPDWTPTRYEDPADPRQIGVTARYEF
ncbi:TonB-dependent receptor [Pelagicoccus sp. SDUM812002]|uniref:TonB-dependent receptor n=1 Tax=Pelagicoccus sp. SDUM812002 TaxID=3041266 RepID=UPI00280FB541|nr:TonB-dependent receptor [Pelagicoccus sp. SDUM812002]MDQ8188404.1 TonB-dependent receptor [Pelagicoccus sp. SDUM812002]